jgi:hypothetical protein
MEQVRTLSTVVIADPTWVRPVTTTTDLRDLVANIDFYWLDVSVRDETVRNDALAQLGLEASDVSWASRFGQSPGMVIDRRGLRAVTWLAEAARDVAEVHVLCSPRGVVTVWSGDPAALGEARAHFAYRAAELNCRTMWPRSPSARAIRSTGSRWCRSSSFRSRSSPVSSA